MVEDTAGKREAAPPAPKAEPQRPAKKVCPGCGKANEVAATFCYACGVKLPAEASVDPVGEPAGFWIRTVAMTIDLAVAIGIAYFLIGLIPDGSSADADTGSDLVTSLNRLSRSEQAVVGWGILALALGIIFTVNLVFSTVSVGAFGRTLGKALCGIKIVRSDGKRIGFGMSFMRGIAYAFSALPLGLGFLWIPLTSMKRGWHDHLCDTRVVRPVR